MSGTDFKGTMFIGGAWRAGQGVPLTSENPASGAVVWQGASATAADVDAAIQAARKGFQAWSTTSLEARLDVVNRYKALVQEHQALIAESIAKETGKTLWDSKNEAAAVLAKIDISIKAYHERTGSKSGEANGIQVRLNHRPHGVMAVFAPYNFPMHLPNGHILPALIAGNSVVLKPSEHTPLAGEVMVGLWERAGLPAGVMNLVQGERETGKALAAHDGIDGLLFTGSSATGAILHQQFAGKPHKILALEMGGNNPLIVWEAADLSAASYHIIQSAFLTTGQRCSCSRRVFIPEGKVGDALLERLIAMTGTLKIGAYTDTPEPFMGPLINNVEADKIIAAQQHLQSLGGKTLVELKRLSNARPFLTPGIIDATAIAELPDREYFGPLLQIIRVPSLDVALTKANQTQFGLTAGILTDNPEHFETFLSRIHAGVVNWNRPITGASGNAPYGGLGCSGNHRPSAYYAADYCAYPVATQASPKLEIPSAVTPGITLAG